MQKIRSLDPLTLLSKHSKNRAWSWNFELNYNFLVNLTFCHGLFVSLLTREINPGLTSQERQVMKPHTSYSGSKCDINLDYRYTIFCGDHIFNNQMLVIQIRNCLGNEIGKNGFFFTKNLKSQYCKFQAQIFHISVTN